MQNTCVIPNLNLQLILLILPAQAVVDLLPAELVDRVKAIIEAHEKLVQTWDWQDEIYPEKAKTLRLAAERFQCVEPLFVPQLISSEFQSKVVPLPELIYEALDSCESDDQKHELYGNVVLSGNSSMIPNLSRRLESELARMWRERAGNHTQKISTVQDAIPKSPWRVTVAGMDAAWSGASKLAADRRMHKKWFSKETYDEYGMMLSLPCTCQFILLLGPNQVNYYPGDTLPFAQF